MSIRPGHGNTCYIAFPGFPSLRSKIFMCNDNYSLFLQQRSYSVIRNAVCLSVRKNQYGGKREYLNCFRDKPLNFPIQIIFTNKRASMLVCKSLCNRQINLYFHFIHIIFSFSFFLKSLVARLFCVRFQTSFIGCICHCLSSVHSHQ